MARTDQQPDSYSRIKSIAATLVATSGLLTAMWAIDEHYATAADVRRIETEMAKQVQQIRASQLEDQIFLYQLKKQQRADGKLDPVDEAMLQRQLRQLNAVNRAIKTSDDKK